MAFLVFLAASAPAGVVDLLPLTPKIHAKAAHALSVFDVTIIG
jgi:hypothetical protein